MCAKAQRISWSDRPHPLPRRPRQPPQPRAQRQVQQLLQRQLQQLHQRRVRPHRNSNTLSYAKSHTKCNTDSKTYANTEVSSNPETSTDSPSASPLIHHQQQTNHETRINSQCAFSNPRLLIGLFFVLLSASLALVGSGVFSKESGNGKGSTGSLQAAAATAKPRPSQRM